MELILLNGRKMEDRESAHRYLKSALRLPAYYGNNLDALADCLSEFGKDIYVILYNAGNLKENLGEYGDKLLDVFREASGEENAFRFFSEE